MRLALSLLTALLLAAFASAEKIKFDDPRPKPILKDGAGSISVRSTVPIPDEVGDTQGKALCREAGITMGQNEMLNHVLGLKASSRKTLGEAENASALLHDEIRAIIKASQVAQTKFGKRDCTVTIVMDKKRLRRLLKEN